MRPCQYTGVGKGNGTYLAELVLGDQTMSIYKGGQGQCHRVVIILEDETISIYRGGEGQWHQSSYVILEERTMADYRSGNR